MFVLLLLLPRVVFGGRLGIHDLCFGVFYRTLCNVDAIEKEKEMDETWIEQMKWAEDECCFNRTVLQCKCDWVK
jgi:hypothetical protein